MDDQILRLECKQKVTEISVTNYQQALRNSCSFRSAGIGGNHCFLRSRDLHDEPGAGVTAIYGLYRYVDIIIIREAAWLSG